MQNLKTFKYGTRCTWNCIYEITVALFNAKQALYKEVVSIKKIHFLGYPKTFCYLKDRASQEKLPGA